MIIEVAILQTWDHLIFISFVLGQK